jgi:hypothetical protein
MGDQALSVGTGGHGDLGGLRRFSWRESGPRRFEAVPLRLSCAHTGLAEGVGATAIQRRVVRLCAERAPGWPVGWRDR